MKRNLYLNLAVTNIKKNLNMYVPYILSAALMLALIYDMAALAAYDGASTVRGWYTVSSLINFGKYVTSFFTLIFMYHTGKYLLRQKKKQIGLYTILGMNKRNVNRVQFIEIFIAHFIALIVGLVVGMSLIKVLFAVFLNLMQIKLLSIGLFCSSATIFIGIIALISFVLTSINSAFRITIANPIDLLKSEQISDKPSRFQWLFTLLGIICLGMGYYMSQSASNPLSALNSFFMAVCFVIAGTFYFMSATLIFLFNQLKKNKRFYYKPRNFIAISSIVHRVKQNAAGLASICVLSTAVLVTLSTTLAVYYGTNETFSRDNLQDFSVYLYVDDFAKKDAITTELDDFADWVNDQFEVSGMRKFMSSYQFFSITNNGFIYDSENSITNRNIDMDKFVGVMLITLDEYNAAFNTDFALNDADVMVCEKGFDTHINLDNIQLLDQTYRAKFMDLPKVKTEMSMQSMVPNSAIIITKNDVIIERIITESKDAKRLEPTQIRVDFNVEGNEKENFDKLKAKVDQLLGGKYKGGYVSRYEMRTAFLELNAGLLFLGIIVGLLFLIATALIIYYKQISEAYQDIGRYDILNKVGMTESEVKKTINLQVLMLFYIPIIFALIHLAFAYKMLAGLVRIVGLGNMQYLTISCLMISIIFIVFYYAFYKISSKAYYNIIC